MKLAGILLVIFGVLLGGVGVFLGYSDVQQYGTSCGSAIGGASAAAGNADMQAAMGADAAGQSIPPSELSKVQDACTSALSSRGTLAWAVLIPGIGLFLTGLVLFFVGRVNEADAAERAARILT